MSAPEHVLAEAVRDGIVVFDHQGAFVHANAGATAISGWSAARDFQKLFDMSGGLVEIRPAKWVELRQVAVRWRGAPVRAVVFTDVTPQIALREAHRTLREVGLVDPVTGLATEPVLRDHLQRSLALAAREERWLGVLWLRLDRLIVSGMQGQRVADEVLRQCAQRVKSGIRESDLAAVFDQNTIVIGLTAMHAPLDARIVAVRLLLALAPPVLIEGRERSVGVSIGAVTASDRSIAVDHLLERADAAAAEAVGSEDPLCLVSAS